VRYTAMFEEVIQANKQTTTTNQEQKFVCAVVFGTADIVFYEIVRRPPTMQKSMQNFTCSVLT